MKKAFLAVIISTALFGRLNSLNAVTFTGTNQPGTTQDFSIPVTPGTTNLAISVSGTSSAYSYLLLKAGAAPASDTDYDFIAAQKQAANAINVELPDLLITNYVLRVSTPSNSLAHSFTVTATNNIVGLRGTNLPATKSIVSTSQFNIGPSSWQYFRVEIPTNLSGWRVVLNSSNTAPDLYIQKDTLPNSSSSLRSSLNTTNDILAFTGAEITPGTYFIGVNQTVNSSTFTLRTELLEFTPLVWDPGTTHLGTEVYSLLDTNGGDHYFRINVQNTALGAWRNALNVLAGDANLYLSKGTPPSPLNAAYKSERAGPDGFIVPSTAFSAGEDWYLMVRATTNSSWNLVSGEPFVTELGTVASDASSGSGNLPMGAEGMRFFRTTTATNQVAWRLWLNGATNIIYVRKNAAPLPSAFDLSQSGQMLVVPPYLVGGVLQFVSVSGIPGSTINLDSRIHAFTDLNFIGSTNLNIADFPYTTFRVQVPSDQLAWQVNTVVSNGDPNIAIRRNFIPNESNNDAYSEASSNVTDSITLVPDTLSDGTFFITVYSSNAHSCTLVSGPPNIPDIDYVSATTNADVNRVGWSIFKLADINQQLGSLGWDLSVSNATPGTRIAIRRNRAPGIWNFRNPNQGSSGFYTLLSTTNFLQVPDNPADVWYVGVYNPSNVLGNFTLISHELTASPVVFDGGSTSRTDIPAGKWQFFQVDVPSDAIGWDVRVNAVTTGSPQIVVRRERLPTSLNTVGFPVPVTATNWTTGLQWAGASDWTGRDLSPAGSSEFGRVLTAGMGRPLEPGTYYIGVLNTSGSNAPMNYAVLSRGIGTNYSIPVIDVDYAGGAVTNSALLARDLAVYRVSVPTNATSWKSMLTVSSGDAVMAVGRSAMPNVTANANNTATNPITAGRLMRKSLDSPNEYFLQLSGATNIMPGPYYIVVASEGQTVATNATRIGTGTAAYTYTSIGELPIPYLGVLETNNDLFFTNTLGGGDSSIISFSNTVDTLGFELTLPQKTGNPWMAISSLFGRLTNPGSPTPADTYGNEGGADGLVSPDIITGSGSYPQHYVAIKARGTGTVYTNSTFTLRIRKMTADPLAFDGGTVSVTNQSFTYQYYKVIVPPDALGWDVRITNVTGSGKLIVCRDFLALNNLPGSWSPGRDRFWPSGANWIADKDWTLRSLSAGGTNEDAHILAMGMNQPLEPGTYYIGILNTQLGSPLSYTLVSRGIGDGYIIPVVDLPFAGGSITNTGLLPREAAYYRINVPAGVTSWQSKLTMTAGEALLVANTNGLLPTVLTGQGAGIGKSMQKLTNEHFAALSPNSAQFFPSGIYYLAVVGEGVAGTNTTRVGTNASSYIIESRGEITPIDLGVANSGVELRHTNSLEAGSVCAYQFTVPPAATSVEAELLSPTGVPVMVLRPGANLPNPGASSPVSGPGSVSTELYGTDGGWTIATGAGDANSSLITLASPSNGVYTIMVKARQNANVFTNASFTLSVRATSVLPLAFDGGTSRVTNQNAGSWRFFQFTVPPGVFGWDLRVTNVTGGVAKLVLRREALPSSLVSYAWGSPGFTTNWPGTNQWAAGPDWTRRTFSADNVNEDNRILAMGMGQPLEPGTYNAGVFNSTTSNSLGYTFISRGIGDGQSLPVTPLAFTGGRVTNTFLAPREAAYYRVDVPANVRGWKVRLTAFSGEVQLLELKDHVPNVDVGTSTSLLAGKSMQKAGNEHLIILPQSTQTNFPATTYYLAVVGEGLNPAAPTRVGAGSSSYEIVSEGEFNLTSLGVANSSGVVVSNNLQGGESAFYTFTIPTNTLAVEMRLENRVGNPLMVLSTNSTFPDPGGVVQGSRDAYGNDGGITPIYLGTNIITVPNPTPGTYQLAVKARLNALAVYPDASYNLRVRTVLAPDLNFCVNFNTNGLDNAASSSLVDNQRNYYRVVVPTNVDNQPVIGWELRVSQTAGVAALRVRKNLLPSDSVPNGMAPLINSAVIVPPFLTPGTWYVEVIGTNSTTYTLTSSNLNLQRPAWTMPGIGESPTTPGVVAPEFADSGVDTNGLALPGDQGIDLQSDYYHFYAVRVPTNNGGLMSVQLAAISGNPDFYLRQGQPPTLAHTTNGLIGQSLDRLMNGNLTDYGNWVPISGTAETRLKPDIWYIAVRAASGANARYRLRVSTGQIQDLALDGGSATSQSVASNNWRYYRFQVPSQPPANWNLTFSQLSGDVVMHLRDVVPPGNGIDNAVANIKDWTTDLKNSGPYATYDAPGTYSFTAPPLRPGNTYYVGFRAKADSTFSVSSSVSGPTNTSFTDVAFYGGFVTNTIPPNGTLMYRIMTPADALRWRHTSTHSNTVQVYMENGTYPTLNSQDDFRSSGTANSTIASQFLITYPWLPSQSYYMTVTNTTAINQPFSLTMNGSPNTADDDADGLPDSWEVFYFSNINQTPAGDSDGDGVNNGNEYLDGTNPTDRNSVRPRLNIGATNGIVNVNPFASNYTIGDFVTITAVPNPGYEFTGWTGAVVTKTNPLDLIMASNIIITAKFRVPGDDFDQRIGLTGFNAVAAPLTNSGATKESGESSHAGNSGGHSLWWTWTAPTSGIASVATDGSTFRTLLGVYTGTNVAGLTLITNSAAALGSNGTRISFNAIAGTNYHFAVDGFGGATGAVALAVSITNNTPATFILTNATLLTNGGFQFNILSATGLVVRVEAADTFGAWNIIAVITNTTGTNLFVDATAPGAPIRYYRAALGAGAGVPVVPGSTNPPVLDSALRLPDGKFQFTILGVTNRNVRIDTGADAATFSPLTTLTNITSPVIFTDTNAPGADVRFYRALLQ